MILKRQGDILFEQVADAILPGRNLEIKDGVIARGEATGHAHRLEGGKLFRSPGANGLHTPGLVIDAPDGATVAHEEHDRIELEPGIWLVHNQTEYVAPGETSYVYD